MFKRTQSALCLALSCLIATPSTSFASNELPDIGTAAGGTLSINQENVYGDAYMRIIRASQPVIGDPVLNEYVESLGFKLVANADDVKTPFHFFLIRDRNINAFAFFGGYVALHSGLFLHSQSESELASVVAHEIAHITQRHLARSMEDQARRTPLTIAALAGSLLLAIAAPEAGIAALTATQAGSMQAQINYTRSNEKEADRFGMSTLVKAGFDPAAMPRFFSRLADQYRYASTPPAFLLTHPLPEDRISDSRARAEKLSPVKLPASTNFHFAKARIIARYVGLDQNAALDWVERTTKKTTNKEVLASLDYAKALVYLDNKQIDEANTILKKLFDIYPNNNFILDALSDLHIAKEQFAQAEKLLEDSLVLKPNNPVLLINLANVHVEAQQYDVAQRMLQRFTHEWPNDSNGWSLLSKTEAALGNTSGELAARGEIYALRANWNKAIQVYTQASQIAELGSLEQARYDARIDQLLVQRDRFMALQ
jgi:predicted Zn-dependent protease